MSRREFPKSVKAEIVRRAMTPEGLVACEGCGLILGKKPYQIDHTIPDALFLDKGRKLTAADGKLLGQECCHGPKTHQVDIPTIAKVKRVEARDKGIIRPKGQIKSPGFTKPAKAKQASRHDWAPELPQRQLYAKVKT
jgi:hypothetical protein